ncbi:hypothetical protein BXY51_009200, partial [Actinoplanes cyaneus]|nr:hypothetical protein [Actinoplanes cyaneus]MCW2144592.1 hypothetical protein [Actinoplanes cyaneus]
MQAVVVYACLDRGGDSVRECEARVLGKVS